MGDYFDSYDDEDRIPPELLPVKLSSGKIIFVLECDFEDKDVAKNAGFWWHTIDGCNRASRGLSCFACSANIEKKWWTPNYDTARTVIEFADERTTAILNGEKPAGGQASCKGKGGE